MSAPLQTVLPGQPLTISAGDWNAAIEAARAHQFGGARPAVAPTARPHTILVRNDTGGDLDRFAVLGIDGPVIAPADLAAEFNHRVAVKGIAPTSDHVGNGRLVILAENLPDGELGRAWAGGVCPALIDMQSAEDTTADADDATSAHLVSGGGPMTILWADASETHGGNTDGTGVQAAIVRFGTVAAAQLSFRFKANFSATGQWTVPSGVTRIWAFCVAAGGTGGLSGTRETISLGSEDGEITFGAGGGGGGTSGQSIVALLRVVPGEVLDIEVGKNTGFNGENTTILDSDGVPLVSLQGGFAGDSAGPRGTVGAGPSSAGSGSAQGMIYAPYSTARNRTLEHWYGKQRAGSPGQTGGIDGGEPQDGYGGAGGIPTFRVSGAKGKGGYGGTGNLEPGVDGEDGYVVIQYHE
ncbi:MAG: hypothetical protein ACOC3G_05990 [Phycisphaeraceae bacterium]